MGGFCSLTLRDFIDQAASGAPTPGGGGVAALTGALGSAMASMAANLTAGKPKFARHDALMRRTLAELAPLLESLRQGIDDDALAFTRLSRAYRLPKDGEEAAIGRRKEIHEALLDAMRPPERVVADCRRAMELLPPLAEAANPNLLSDVEVAAIMLAAAARAALVNLRVNARQLADGEVGEAEAGAARRLAEVEELSEKTLALINERRA